MCMHPAFELHKLQQRFPHALEDWINYHQLIGVDHVQVYDIDRSFASTLKKSNWFSDKASVTYIPKFPSLISNVIQSISDQWPYCVEVLAYDHCIFSNYHKSKWVLFVHSLDGYIQPAMYGGPPMPPPNLLHELQMLPGEQICAVSVRACHYGDPPGLSQNMADWTGYPLIARFLHRSEVLGPWHRSETLVQTAHVRYMISSHKPVCRYGTSSISIDPLRWRAHHYVDRHAPRCAAMNCTSLDSSITWAVPHLMTDQGKGTLPSIEEVFTDT